MSARPSLLAPAPRRDMPPLRSGTLRPIFIEKNHILPGLFAKTVLAKKRTGAKGGPVRAVVA